MLIEMSGHQRSQNRSQSPRRRTDAYDSQHARRRSPRRLDDRHFSGPSSRAVDVILPYNQRQLSKHDLDRYRTLFAGYLDIQKGLSLEDLDSIEAKGRWKSFIGKWNRGDLPRSYYDPEFRPRMLEPTVDAIAPKKSTRGELPYHKIEPASEDEYGPTPPKTAINTRKGPSVPDLQDLQQKREQDQEDRADHLEQVRAERKAERKLQTERLNELAPRAEPGTRDRQLEKKREMAASNKAFAQAKEADGLDVADDDLMGDGTGLDAYKTKLRTQQRQKNERELRREEVLRARAAEREERLAAHRSKEAKTMETLRALAQQRYGNAS